MGVPPKSSIWMGFSIRNSPFWGDFSIPLRSSKVSCGREKWPVAGTTSGAATRGAERGASGQGPVAAWWKNGGELEQKKSGFFKRSYEKNEKITTFRVGK